MTDADDAPPDPFPSLVIYESQPCNITQLNWKPFSQVNWFSFFLFSIFSLFGFKSSLYVQFTLERSQIQCTDAYPSWQKPQDNGKGSNIERLPNGVEKGDENGGTVA